MINLDLVPFDFYNPVPTFFKVTYKRYTNFMIEQPNSINIHYKRTYIHFTTSYKDKEDKEEDKEVITIDKIDLSNFNHHSIITKRKQINNKQQPNKQKRKENILSITWGDL